MQPFDRQTLEQAFDELGERAWSLGRTVEIAVYGGAAVMLTLQARAATRDVDAVFETDKELVRRLVREMAAAHGWDENWLNDGVKGFISAADSDPANKALFGSFPSDDRPGLRVFVAKPHYLFAMKCLAMRASGLDSRDVEDIRQLGALIGVTTARGGHAARAFVLSRRYDRSEDTIRARRDLFGAEFEPTSHIMTFVRPQTLVDVSVRRRAAEDAFDPSLREFLDHFYGASDTERARAIQDRPMSMDPLRDAYIAATAEHLAGRWGLTVPAWTDDHGFDLEQPHFSGGLESLKAILLVESPIAFRRRLLFVSANALDRASMHAA